ncbi:tol-pal system protein YbgF [Aquamicrobium soli]|jgi:tol-pal system protein YbgF|uniref:Cell division coordinator CpoB n=1 Tax=Aquamicrobium soli TaxID=1811518 RepID=A0ABV7KIU1_9HYPH
MHFRLILSGTLAMLLLSGAAASANGAGSSTPRESGFSFHLPSIGLPGVFGQKDEARPVQLAQTAGTTALEDQIRQLNGKIEELNFQVLQMQEQIRKQQEDNEFRFQQLEQTGSGGKQQKSDAGAGTDSNVAAAPQQTPDTGASANAAPADAGAAGGGQSVEDVIIDSGNGDPGKLIPGTGAPPKTFGTITVDKNGNVIDAEGNTQSTTPDPAPAAKAQTGTSGNSVVAALPATDNADELYRNSYQFILSGDYGTAEQGFRDHISRFPKDAKAADAHYWLGESLLGQQKYRDAAEVFLAASKDYPKAKKAPDMLLKLGVSLVGLKQRDVACATFGEIGKRYPNASSALKARVKQERAQASC